MSSILASLQRKQQSKLKQMEQAVDDCENMSELLGFEQQRIHSKQSCNFFKEVISVLEERSELEGNYGRQLQKLSAKLFKATKDAQCALDESWRIVAEEMEAVAVVHRNLSTALQDEIIMPLKTVFDSQFKSRKLVELTVEKSAKKLSEKKLEQLKIKRKCHAISKEFEKTQKYCCEESRRPVRLASEKQIAKVQTKRARLEESVTSADQNYLDLTILVERQRQEFDAVVRGFGDRLTAFEEQRLSQLQTAMGRYQRHMSTVGPNLLQIYKDKSLESAMNIDLQTDLKTLASNSRSLEQGHKLLLLCDFYAEDIAHVIAPDRRQESLRRYESMLEKQFEKERKGKEGIEHLCYVYETTPRYGTEEAKLTLRERLKDTCLLLNFIDFNLYKVKCSLASLNNCTMTSHRLSKYLEKYKDKAGLRQSVLKIPAFAYEELNGGADTFQRCFALPAYSSTDIHMSNSSGQTSPLYSSSREVGDGQSPSQSNNAIDDQEDIYQSVDTVDQVEEMTLGDCGGQTQCLALYKFEAQHSDELSIEAGSVIHILAKPSQEWWEGSLEGKRGLFPATYVKNIEELEEAYATV